MADLAVLFGGPSPEHDVSILTGLQAARTLAEGPQRVRAIYWSKRGEFHEVAPDGEAESYLDGVPKDARRIELVIGAERGFVEPGGRLGRPRPLDLDVVVVCCHGGPGEDGSIQALLDLAGIRYTGPTLPGAAIGLDKLAFGALVREAGLPSLERVELRADGADPPFPGPYIAKPRFGGSSIGIEVLEDVATARHRLRDNPHFRQGAVIEPYRPDLFDLQVAVRTWPSLEVSAIERPIRTASGGHILDYRDKYVAGEGMAAAPRELPALIPDALAGQMTEIAHTVARIAGVRGVARIDVLSDGESACFVNEINTIPGSLSRYLWIDPDVPFDQLLADLVAEARARPAHHYETTGADGTVLASAGSIAAKLG